MFCRIPTKRILTSAITILLLAACSAPVTTPAPSPIVLPTAIPPAPTPTADPILGTGQLIKGYAAAWAAGDPDELLSFYAKDIKSYDATAYGLTFSYFTIDDVLHGDYVNGVFDVKINSFFVSEDGRFATAVGTFTQKNSTGKSVPLPFVELLEINEGKFVWIYDYYGGASSEALPIQELPASASQPASSNQVITDTKAIITEWETAYNAKDAQTFISFYSDRTKYTQVIVPQWRVFTKDTLLQDVTSRFNSEKFASRLDRFFVSADGHFVAVQGTYTDAKAFEIPMVILLELENGKIIEQYDYLVLE